MANGDKAAAKGWTTYPSTQAHSLGYDDINYAMDRTADEVDARVAADNLKLDASKIRVTATPMTAGTAAVGDIRLW
jgi:hypothetical protein